ncbi:DUF6510 family protein [Streptomyces sp. NBC_01716]|uniref:DUF6510 family protein n=1 Tax=Streptomyces sp. NBC_01716 TaxID=2975917 RepID=UPI002E3638ED|nr:DUF6510 family protein [Streptomyces sp. NBC_01716]
MNVNRTRDEVSDEAYQDGNMLGGPLSEIFAVDLTGAVGSCAGCGRRGPVAQLRVYDRAPGLVARCPRCEEVVIRLVRGKDTAWLDLHGASSLTIPLDPSAT